MKQAKEPPSTAEPVINDPAQEFTLTDADNVSLLLGDEVVQLKSLLSLSLNANRGYAEKREKKVPLLHRSA